MIKIDKINKSFGENHVLKDFSADIIENKMNTIMAPSGAGKTTLLRILLGLEMVDSGLISGLSGKKISCVFQEDRLVENLSAYANIKIVCDKSCDEIITVLKMIGLFDAKDQKVSTLSGGMKRRVAIARAIMAESDILILDEPFKGLDDKTKSDVISLILNSTIDKTIILVTHIEQESLAFGEANWIYIKD